MRTTHRVFYKGSSELEEVSSNSIDLILTSPPYPMIEMWDGTFSKQNPEIAAALAAREGNKAFELMHRVLDPVWAESWRVLKEGGFACINIGDATRTVNGDFVLYSNHTRLSNKFFQLGFSSLPCILWRKQTNAPNKFMGSGTLPSGAYVTLEHEYILIFRKKSKRSFHDGPDKTRRRESAIFWEERNNWYSDVWFDIKGTLQSLNDKVVRLRSGAYPFELAYRLINMYSVKGDVILDPFLGTGTTMAAAMASCRNSIGYEIDPTLKGIIDEIKNYICEYSNRRIEQRIKSHLEFVKDRKQKNKPIKHKNKCYNFGVITSQEKELFLNHLKSATTTGKNQFEVEYIEKMNDLCSEHPCVAEPDSASPIQAVRKKSCDQLILFT